MKTIQKGFTLIELMIVVAIIGILAAIAIPAYQDYIVRSQVSEGLAMASSMKASVSEYYADRGDWPVDNDDLGITDAPTGKYVSDISVNNGEIVITFGNDVNTNIDTQTLTLLPGASANGDVIWQCGDRDVTASATWAAGDGAADGGSLTGKYRPSNCRG
jgi:type IV pilus assembly protein PilA